MVLVDPDAMDDSDLIPISAIQHYRYCPKQCALIHIDGLWAENRFTAEGQQLHQRVDTPGSRTRTPTDVGDNEHPVDGCDASLCPSAGRAGVVRVVRSMPLRSAAFGIVGKADCVEIRTDEFGKLISAPKPVEYKRGRPKQDNTDAVQLCAQALCLEEMTGWTIESGALFYHTTRKRQETLFDTTLRLETADTIKQIRSMIRANRTPVAAFGPKCRNCSLRDFCLPKGTDRSKNPGLYLKRAIRVALSDDGSSVREIYS